MAQNMKCKLIRGEIKGYIDPYILECEKEGVFCYLYDATSGGGISCFKK